jgi:hypothetical protein
MKTLTSLARSCGLFSSLFRIPFCALLSLSRGSRHIHAFLPGTLLMLSAILPNATPATAQPNGVKQEQTNTKKIHPRLVDLKKPNKVNHSFYYMLNPGEIRRLPDSKEFGTKHVFEYISSDESVAIVKYNPLKKEIQVEAVANGECIIYLDHFIGDPIEFAQITVGWQTQNPVLPYSWKMYIPDPEVHNFGGDSVNFLFRYIADYPFEVLEWPHRVVALCQEHIIFCFRIPFKETG